MLKGNKKKTQQILQSLNTRSWMKFIFDGDSIAFQLNEITLLKRHLVQYRFQHHTLDTLNCFSLIPFYGFFSFLWMWINTKSNIAMAPNWCIEWFAFNSSISIFSTEYRAKCFSYRIDYFTTFSLRENFDIHASHHMILPSYWTGSFDCFWKMFSMINCYCSAHFQI